MRHAMAGAVTATTLLLGLVGSAAAQGTPPKAADKPADKKEAPAKAAETKAPAKATETKAPAKDTAPKAPGKPWKDWDTLTGDWWGNRTKLHDKGIDAGLRLTYDFTRVQSGGANPHENAGRYWLDANLNFDLNKLAKFTPGGTVYVSYWQMGGENGSEEFGAFNNISSIDSEFRQQLAELYYANTFLKDRFDTRIGKMDPTERFNHSEYTQDFMNLGANFPPTYFPSPRYPETAVGADLFYRGKGLYVGGAIFDGSKQQGVETGHGGASHFYGSPGDLFFEAEAGYRWTGANRPVRFALGAWNHSGDFTSLSGRTHDTTTGWYALAEGMLWRKNREDAKDTRGAYLVFRYGSIEDGICPLDWQTTTALVFKGPLASRKNDSIGLAWTYGSVTGDDGGTIRYGTEQVVEFYYRAQLTPFASIAPGVQYVGNPGGTHQDAVVLGFRVVIDF